MINELYLIDVVRKCLCADSSTMTACSYCSDDIDLNHYNIGFILISILNAPFPHLLVAHTSSDLDQVLSHCLAYGLTLIFFHIVRSHLSDAAEMLDPVSC